MPAYVQHTTCAAYDICTHRLRQGTKLTTTAGYDSPTFMGQEEVTFQRLPLRTPRFQVVPLSDFFRDRPGLRLTERASRV